MKNKIKTLVAAIALSGTMAGGQLNAQDTIKTATDTTKTITAVTDTTKKDLWTTVGFNAVETAVTSQGNARIRAYAELGLSYKKAELGYSGMNEFTQNLKTYFGRHVVVAWLKDKKLKLIGVVKTTAAEGVIDTKFGLRYLISDKHGIYGRVDVSANKDGWDATFFLGKTLGKKKTGSVELFESAGVDFKGKISPYTELQLNKEVFKWLNVFVRWEMAGDKYKDNTYLFGISKMLK